MADARLGAVTDLIVELSPTVRAHLKRLVETGLFGDTVSEVARHLILTGLQRAVRHGFIPARGP